MIQLNIRGNKERKNINAEDKHSYDNVGGFVSLETVLILNKVRKTIEIGRIQLDNQYTSDVFINPRLVKIYTMMGGATSRSTVMVEIAALIRNIPLKDMRQYGLMRAASPKSFILVG